MVSTKVEKDTSFSYEQFVRSSTTMCSAVTSQCRDSLLRMDTFHVIVIIVPSFIVISVRLTFQSSKYNNIIMSASTTTTSLPTPADDFLKEIQTLLEDVEKTKKELLEKQTNKDKKDDLDDHSKTADDKGEASSATPSKSKSQFWKRDNKKNKRRTRKRKRGGLIFLGVGDKGHRRHLC